MKVVLFILGALAMALLSALPEHDFWHIVLLSGISTGCLFSSGVLYGESWTLKVWRQCLKEYTDAL